MCRQWRRKRRREKRRVSRSMRRKRRRREKGEKETEENIQKKKIWIHSQNVVSEISGAKAFLESFQGVQKVKVIV